MTTHPRVIQRRRLIRARDLAGFRQALVDLAIDAGDPLAARRRALILPTRASVEIFRQTLERRAADAGRRSIVIPELVTRDEWLARLHSALPGAAALLTRVEREVLIERAARAARTRGWLPDAPFDIRPGLVAEILNLYDELLRRQRTVRRFSRILFDQLRVERGSDRGSEGLIQLTCFLGFTFLGYERSVAAMGALDEHTLRRRLLDDDLPSPVDHVIVAVADHPADPRGLWPADFDLLGRLRGVSRLDVVMTDETHDAGFRERIDRELPGIEEVQPDLDVRPSGDRTTARPILVRPPGDDPDALCFVHRDREEELREVARTIRTRAARTGHVVQEPTAIVFHRPLPYLYLARNVLIDAHIPFQAFDALPLAAEPYAALLDLVLAFGRAGGIREAAVSLLRSPWLSFAVDGEPVQLDDAAALDVVLTERRATGEADTYAQEVSRFFRDAATRNGIDSRRAFRAAAAAAAIRTALLPFREGPTASSQVRALSSFLRRHERGSVDDWPERFRRARTAVLAVLDGLNEALRRHDDPPRPHEALTAAIHHWIEARTFAPPQATGGVHLVDAIAARFGDFDNVHLVGLVESDWPDRPRRSVFFTTGLLKSLGWPQESDQVRAQQAAFRDLLGLPATTLQLHGFQLEGDSVVAISPMIDAARGRPSVRAEPSRRRAVFADEVLTAGTPEDPQRDTDSGEWLRLRLRRPPLTEPQYGGFVDPQAAQAYRVSRVDRYVDCPFKYFAETVLGLPEEREEASGLTPLERGTLVHALFEEFYRAWHADARGTITGATLPDALELFSRLADRALASYPEADRALERTRLLGSIIARGVAERVFELEANAGGEVIDRLVEFDLRGPFAFPVLHGLSHRTIQIRGKADRIDVFADGGLRVVDYKLSRLPDLDTSVQLAVYAHAAKQALEAQDGRPHQVNAAMYIAFGDERQTAGPLGSRNDPVGVVVERRASDFAATIERIEAGRFPPQPKRPAECQWCRYAGVCRKEYLIDSPPEESESASDAGRASGGGVPASEEY